VKPWATLPLSEDAVTKAFFKSSIRCIVGDGRSTLFWLDPWVDGKSIADFVPHMFVAAHPGIGIGGLWWWRWSRMHGCDTLWEH
jgi:hypothetical protein